MKSFAILLISAIIVGGMVETEDSDEREMWKRYYRDQTIMRLYLMDVTL